MGYGFTCDACGSVQADADPALMGQIHEGWFRTSDLAGHLAAEQIMPNQTITFCAECTLNQLL
jgi:hypothetical protein